jgi:hypothetical protein
MRAIYTLAALALSAAPAAAQYTDSPDIARVMSAVVGAIREEFTFDRVVLDRVVIDTTKRLMPPLMSGREHRFPEDWAKTNRVEVVQSDMTSPVCRSGNVDCALPQGVAAAIGLAEPTVRGDSARVIARYRKTVGAMVSRVTTIVEEFHLRKSDGEWKVTNRTIRTTG